MMKIFLVSILLFTMAFASGCGTGSGGSSQSPSGGTSIGGSTATMAVYENTLFSLIDNAIVLVDLELNEVVNGATIYDYSAETLYVYKHYLYVAGRFGVNIYNISEPNIPVYVATYDHATACDPVVIEDDVGYLTLRNRSGCGGDVNRLEVVDFSAPGVPVKISDFPMVNPFGLAKAPNFLAVCQEASGLSLLDVTDVENIFEIDHYSNYNCFDLIYSDETLYMTAVDGIYQFTTYENELVELSRIHVGF